MWTLPNLQAYNKKDIEIGVKSNKSWFMADRCGKLSIFKNNQ